MLIDQPLAVYRHHGGNGLARHPQLNGFFSFRRCRGPDNSQLARLLLLDYLIDCADDLIGRSSPRHLIRALQELGRHASFHGAGFCLSRRVWKNRKELRAQLGIGLLLAWYTGLVCRKI